MNPQTQPTGDFKKSTHKQAAISGELTTIIQDLKKTLADEYFLQLKTQYCHWNVEGPLFFSLHKLFESQYTELFTLVDRCAEIIRANRCKAPGSFKDFKELTAVQEMSGDKFSANQMIEGLYQDHTHLALALKARLRSSSESEETTATVLYEDLISFHEKSAWMILSHRS